MVLAMTFVMALAIDGMLESRRSLVVVLGMAPAMNQNYVLRRFVAASSYTGSRDVWDVRICTGSFDDDSCDGFDVGGSLV